MDGREAYPCVSERMRMRVLTGAVFGRGSSVRSFDGNSSRPEREWCCCCHCEVVEEKMRPFRWRRGGLLTSDM